MQRTSLLHTVAAAAVLTVLLLLARQKANAQTETTLYSFCSITSSYYCLDGAEPASNLTPDGYGGFYGTTYGGQNGGGTVFQLLPEPAAGCPSGSNTGNGWCELVLYNFCQVSSASICLDGSLPLSSLLLIRTGTLANPITTLYGTTMFGGANDTGTVFELSPEPLPDGCPSGSNPGNYGWCETVSYSFCTLANCTDGAFSVGSLVRDSTGNLYGVVTNALLLNPTPTATNGVFELSPNGNGGWTEALIYLDPNIPLGGLAIDASGDLYGVDEVQTTVASGSVFKLTNSAGFWEATIIHTFAVGSLVGDIPDGASPNGQVVIDTAGNVYGTTQQGGSKNLGTVWKLTPVTTGIAAGYYKEKILHSFTSAKTGNFPQAGVTLDSSGNIYGATSYGGKDPTACGGQGCGTVFELAHQLTSTGAVTYKYKLLTSFNGTDGGIPLGSPIPDSSGNLYGTTGAGGASNMGTVFEVMP